MVTLENMTVGELVKKALKKRGFSQIELSQRSSISTSQISRIINGERGASLETLLTLADALGIKRSEMLRVAAGLPEVVPEDEWIEEMNYKLNLIPKNSRNVAEKVLDSLIEDHEPRRVPKSVKGKA